MATMDSKYIQHIRKIGAVLLRLISRTLNLFPFGLVMGKRKLTAVCSHQTRIGNLDAHLI